MNTTMSPRYISCADTAKLVRQALKKAFPGVKFSVRSSTYSMGASISVGWTDGPTGQMVDSVVSPFKGADFDGMIDLKTSRESWLTPDGAAVLAYAEGTSGSRGSKESEQYLQPSFKAERVRFGSDYIHTSRSCSKAMTERALAKVGARFGIDVSKVEVVESTFGAYIKRGNDVGAVFGHHSLSDLVHQERSRRCVVPAGSKEV